MVGRLAGGQKVAGSNPAVPTIGTIKHMKRAKRPTAWWVPPALLLATGMCAACIASAYTQRDAAMFFAAVVVTAFTALLTWSAYTMRDEERRARS